MNDTIARGGNTIEGITVRQGFTPEEKRSQAYIQSIGRMGDSRLQSMNARLSSGIPLSHPERDPYASTFSNPERESNESMFNRLEAQRPRLLVI